MHDIERGGNATAMRLAALAALRNAQGDGALDDDGDPAEAGQRSAHGPFSRSPAMSREAEDDPAPRLGGEVSAGVYAAVEAAVKRSRVEFLARLVEYRRKLDCDVFHAAGPEALGESLDEAQFVAHRIAGLGKTLGFADLGDTARQAEAAITAYKLEKSTDLRQTAISRICKLSGMIDTTCSDQDGYLA